jgi:glycosyltransferase involved in cell wall biosynthesis
LNNKKLLFIVNVDWFFISHRLPIALKAISKGYEVHIATSITDRLDFLLNKGLIVHPINLHRSQSGIIAITSEFLEIFSLVRKISPDIVHLVTIKPVLLGGLASRLLRTPSVVSAISGLGFVFINNGFTSWLRRKVLSVVYRLALGHSNQRVIFQNFDDKKQLSKLTSLSLDNSTVIQGSGVNLSRYKVMPLPNRLPIILLAARLLADKGVREFVQAADLVNKTKVRARFVLVGDTDEFNPASIQEQELSLWKESSSVELWGHRNDMENVLSNATIVVLPSYREGFPKILVEAASCGRVIITTDVPGCRDAIEKDVTGLLVPVRNVRALAKAVSKLLNDPILCKKMGIAGRERAERLFDIKKIVQEHTEIYEQLTINYKA